MCNVHPIFRDLSQFLLIVTVTSEVLPSSLQLYTSSFVLTCRFTRYLVDTYLLCCVRIGLDWIRLLGHQLDWIGLGSVARGFGLDWTFLTQSISYSVRDAVLATSVSRGPVTFLYKLHREVDSLTGWYVGLLNQFTSTFLDPHEMTHRLAFISLF